MNSGKIVQVIGPVVDVEFPVDQALPDINNALVVYKTDSKQKVILEVALELGDGVIRSSQWNQQTVYNAAWKCLIQVPRFRYQWGKKH